MNRSVISEVFFHPDVHNLPKIFGSDDFGLAEILPKTSSKPAANVKKKSATDLRVEHESTGLDR